MPSTFNYLNIPAATSTLVKVGGGVLHTVVVSQGGATSGTLSLYDNAAATGTTPLISTVDTFNPRTYTYDVVFNNGLAAKNSSSPNVVITYQ